MRVLIRCAGNKEQALAFMKDKAQMHENFKNYAEKARDLRDKGFFNPEKPFMLFRLLHKFEGDEQKV